MLQWTVAADGRRLMAIVHHTVEVPEYAYGKDSHVGLLVKALSKANRNGWTVVDMKKDWKVVYPAEKH